MENLLLPEILKAVLHLKEIHGSPKDQIIEYVNSNNKNLTELLPTESNLNEEIHRALEEGIKQNILKERNGKYRLGESVHLTEYHLKSIDNNQLCTTCGKTRRQHQRSRSRSQRKGASKSGSRKRRASKSRAPRRRGGKLASRRKGRRSGSRKTTKSSYSGRSHGYNNSADVLDDEMEPEIV